MSVCSVPSCFGPGKRFSRFPLKDKELFKVWLEKVNNPLLFSLTAENVYRSYRVCERHFEEKWLQKSPYPGSTRRVVFPGAYPTLFLGS